MFPITADSSYSVLKWAEDAAPVILYALESTLAGSPMHAQLGLITDETKPSQIHHVSHHQSCGSEESECRCVDLVDLAVFYGNVILAEHLVGELGCRVGSTTAAVAACTGLRNMESVFGSIDFNSTEVWDADILCAAAITNDDAIVDWLSSKHEVPLNVSSHDVQAAISLSSTSSMRNKLRGIYTAIENSYDSDSDE